MSATSAPDKAADQKYPHPVAVDLFCGIGGLTCGLQRAGISVVAGYDADPSCRHAYEVNNEATFVHRRIEETTAAEVNAWLPRDTTRILVGCAPCQPFSSYSSSTRRRDSWRLLRNFGDLIESVKPDLVSMENVTRLRSFNSGRLFSDFVQRLKESYEVTSFNVKCELYGVPQSRRRLVLFASRFGPVNMIKPRQEKSGLPTVRAAIGDLPPLRHGEVDSVDRIHKAQRLAPIGLARIRVSKPGGTWEEWPPELRARCHRRKSGRSYRNVYGRMEWDKVAPTITTGCFNYGRGRFGHPTQDRAISLREAALLQTFPPDYEFVAEDQKALIDQIGRHIGNAVPVALGEAIGKSMLAHLEGYGHGY